MKRLLSTLAAIGLLWTALGTATAGTWYVANQGDNTIHRFSANGTDLGSFSADGNEPVGVAVDRSGNVYVSLFGDNVIRKFSPNGTDLGIFANTGLANPAGMVFDPQGNLYVDNYGAVVNGIRQGFVHEFSPSGADLGLVVSDFPTDISIARDATGNLYVDDDGAIRGVHKFSSTGSDLGLIGGGLFPSPEFALGLAFDSKGNLFVADPPANVIREFSSTGAYLGVFATPVNRMRSHSVRTVTCTSRVHSTATIQEFSPSGVDLGTFASAGLNEPQGFAFAASIPEPSALTLLGIGTATLLGYARLRTKKTA